MVPGFAGASLESTHPRTGTPAPANPRTARSHNVRVTPSEELRLTGRAAWRGLVELVNSNDLTHAASIAYYALLSLFPFLLLIISLLGSITASEEQRLAVLTFVFRYFPTRLDFVASQLDAFRQTRIQVGVAGS